MSCKLEKEMQKSKVALLKQFESKLKSEKCSKISYVELFTNL